MNLNRGPQSDCPLTERAQDVPAMHAYTLAAYRDEQASRLYQHACKLERALRAVFAAYDSAPGVDDYIQLSPALTMGDVRDILEGRA